MYDKGDLVRCRVKFRDPANADVLIDPAVVRFKFKTPAAVITTYVYPSDAQLVKEKVGVYHVDLDASTAGTWHYRWETTGTYQGAEEKDFEVGAGNF